MAKQRRKERLEKARVLRDDIRDAIERWYGDLPEKTMP